MGDFDLVGQAPPGFSFVFCVVACFALLVFDGWLLVICV